MNSEVRENRVEEPGNANIQHIPIDQIVVREKIQQREAMNENVIEEYKDEILQNKVFPPLLAFNEGENLLLADGLHRYEAYKKAGVKTVEIEIREGTERDAILYAVGANSTHGLRRTNADKHKAVTTLLTDNEWGSMSDGEIAKQCRVSQPFVSKIRRELTQNGFEFSSSRVAKNGRLIDTAKIGKKPSETSESVEDNSTNEQAQDSSSKESSKSSEAVEPLTTQDEGQEHQRSGENSEGEECRGEDDMDESEGTDPSFDDDMDAVADDERPAEEETDEGEPDAIGEENEKTEDGDSCHAPEPARSELESTEEQETGDIQSLKEKIVTLEEVIREKDQRIADLEKELQQYKEESLNLPSTSGTSAAVNQTEQEAIQVLN